MLIAVNEEGGHEFSRNQGGIYDRLLREERKKANWYAYIIISKTQK